MTPGARRSRHAERLGVALAAALTLAAAPAAAGPLCRDLKGLFTPCPPGTPAAASRRRAHAHGDVRPADGTADGQAAEDPAETRASTKPPRIAKTKLCRDLKGLFTPCPR